MSRRAARMWPLYLGGVLGPFGGAMINVILPEVAQELGTTVDQAAIAVTAYILPFSVSLLVSGTLGQRWGLARTARWGFVAYALGSLVCVVAPSLWPFLLGRAIQGVANAFTTPLLVAMVLHVVPVEREGRALGIYASVQGAGQAFAPLAGGIAAAFSFKWAFGISAVFAILFAAFIGPGGPGKSSPRARVRFGDLLNRRLLLVAVVGVCGQFAASAVVILTGIVAEERFDYNSVERGLAVAGFGIAGLFAGQAVGWLVDRVGLARVGPPMVLLVGASAAVAVLSPVGAVMVLMTWVGGFAAAGNRILVSSRAFQSTPQNRAGAQSIAMSAQFLGTATVPALIPLYAHSVPAVAAIVLAVGVVGTVVAFAESAAR